MGAALGCLSCGKTWNRSYRSIVSDYKKIRRIRMWDLLKASATARETSWEKSGETLDEAALGECPYCGDTQVVNTDEAFDNGNDELIEFFYGLGMDNDADEAPEADMFDAPVDEYDEEDQGYGAEEDDDLDDDGDEHEEENVYCLMCGEQREVTAGPVCTACYAEECGEDESEAYDYDDYDDDESEEF